MRVFDRPSTQPDRLLRVLGLGMALVAAVTCSDRATGPNGIREMVASAASLSLIPRYVAMPNGGPSITVASMSGVLTSADGKKTSAIGYFENANLCLDFDVEVIGSSDDFTLDIAAYDDKGILAFTVTQSLTLTSGANADTPQPVLTYAGPDKAVTALHVSPRNLTLDANASGGLAVTGSDASGGTVAPVRVGWTSRNPTIATVDNDGVVRAGGFEGSTYIVSRSATNAADSVLVTVHAQVERISITPSTAQVIRGQTTTLRAQLVDGGGNPIDNQPVSWTSSDPSVAVVSANGIVTGVKIGTASITADVAGKTATSTVNVVSPLDHIELLPTTVTLASLGQTVALTTRLVAKTGGNVSGISPVFSSGNAKVATVDAVGTVTAVANGTTSVTVTAEEFTATATIVVKQLAASLSVAPKAASVASLGDRSVFTATVVDALGNPIADAPVVWSAADPTVASLNGGVATAVKAGTTSISATVDGKSDEATFIVSPIAKMLAVITGKTSIAVGGTTLLTAKLADANGNPIGDAVATWSTTTPGIVSVSSAGIVTGISAGVGQIVATSGALTGVLSIRVTGSSGGGGGGLTLNLANVERLPRGTQELFVVSGGDGPFTWTVNGIPNGNATFGTIVVSELGRATYTAPATVPTPSTFDVCANQASPLASGCAHVTISPIPSSGADVIVFNDVNTFVAPGEDDPANRQMFANLVSFGGSGPRASARSVMFYMGHIAGYTMSGNGTILGTTIRNLGYATTDAYEAFTSPIPAEYKVIFLILPRTAFTVTEINNLKQFAADGGRIVFIGEYAEFYGVGIAVENQFFVNMGAQMTNAGGAFDCSYWVEGASRIRPHQIMTGVNQLTVACVSEVIPGPNDYPLLYDRTGTHVLAAVAKIDVTPIAATSLLRRGARLTLKPAPVVKINYALPPGANPKDPAGRPRPKSP